MCNMAAKIRLDIKIILSRKMAALNIILTYLLLVVLAELRLLLYAKPYYSDFCEELLTQNFYNFFQIH